MARPKALTKALKTEICDRVLGGETVKSICADAHMPAARTVYRTLAAEGEEEFRQLYARAKELQLEEMEDKLLEIADDQHADAVAVQRARLMVDTRKWIMAKRAPRKYGDRIHQEIEAGNATEAVPVIYIRSSAAPSDP